MYGLYDSQRCSLASCSAINKTRKQNEKEKFILAHQQEVNNHK